MSTRDKIIPVCELSRKTLKQYVDRAVDDAHNYGTPPQKRIESIALAKKKLAMKEDAGAVMGVGHGDPAHVTNPSDNYSAQRSQRKQSYKKILRRKKQAQV